MMMLLCRDFIASRIENPMKLRLCMVVESLSIQIRQEGSEGVAAGEKQGLIEGEKIGEIKQSMDIAHKLHLLGLSAEQISDVTGCSSLKIKKSDPM
jgi:predicted transposase YdaD